MLKLIMHLSIARRHMGGGAIAMWRTAEALRGMGHEMTMTAERRALRYVRGEPIHTATLQRLAKADAVLTVGGVMGRSVRKNARKVKRPVVVFVHSVTRKLVLDSVDLVVWGSQAMKDRAAEQGVTHTGNDLVLWPPVDRVAVAVPEPGPFVTMVNLMPEKGASLFWRVVNELPEVEFLGVVGGWGEGLHVAPNPLPSNARMQKYSTDPRDVYGKSRIMLYMRSEDAGDNWLNGVGLVAVEAAYSGIPTIAHPGRGLMESLGDSAMWVDSHNAADWANAIRTMLEPDTYRKHAELAFARADHYAERQNVKLLETAIEGLL